MYGMYGMWKECISIKIRHMWNVFKRYVHTYVRIYNTNDYRYQSVSFFEFAEEIS